MGYRPLEDYGLIGDLRTAALVGRDGSIDWLCLPRFDSPSVFARLLDHRRGGEWRIGPEGGGEGRQRYEPATNVLETRFETGRGVARLVDVMPVLEGRRHLDFRPELHRRVTVEEGSMRLEVVFRPRFDYARRAPRFRHREYGVLAWDGGEEVLALGGLAGERWELREDEGEVRATFLLEAGESRTLVMRHDDDEVRAPSVYQSDAKLDATRRYWRRWSEDVVYEGAYRERVERSALALKLLFYAPTGAVVAAPTTSLPEVVGGERNWDYRYSWLRDSTYTLFAFHALGKFEELDRYMDFVKKMARREAGHLQIMYGVGGERELAERELEHLEGYRGSRPVRVGNAAVEQFQMDVYGEVLDSVYIWRKRHRMTEGTWELVRRLADETCERWSEPDQGVWEMRGPARDFVFSRMMAWVALDRAVRMAEELELEGDVERWRSERDAIRAEVLDRGWSEERGAFVQHYGTDRMDAANLVLPLVRFLPADDARVIGTVERIVEELGHPSGLLYRYRVDDQLEGDEGAFWVSTFQLAQALAMAGRQERAVEVFERAASYLSPLGLASEELDPETGEMLGNYPQAFTHVGLVNAAHVIARTRRADRPADTMMLEEGPS